MVDCWMYWTHWTAFSDVHFIRKPISSNSLMKFKRKLRLFHLIMIGYLFLLAALPTFNDEAFYRLKIFFNSARVSPGLSIGCAIVLGSCASS